MKSLKPAALTAAFLLGSLLCASAWGDTAPAAEPMPRRPVPLTIQPMPRNKLAPQVAMPKTQPSTPIETLMQPPGTPIPAIGCTAGGCYDASGVRHNTGPAGTTITPAGKMCQRNGAWLQC